MKKSLTAVAVIINLGIFGLVAQTAFAAGAPTYVRSAWCKDGGTKGITKSCTATPAAGDTLVAFCFSSVANETFSISDSQGDTYTVDAQNTRTNVAVGIGHALIATGGSDTVTCATTGASGYLNVMLAEYSGVASVNAIDVTTSANGTTANPSAGLFSTTQPNDLVIAAFGTTNNADKTLSAGTGFTLRQGSGNGKSIFVSGLEDQVVATPKSVTGNFNYSDTTGSWAAVMVALKPAVNDTTPPSTPANLSATAVSTSEIDLTWTASTDNVGVAGYNIYRGGVQVGSSPTTSYADTGLSANTQYTYTVAAFDGSGNLSAQSSQASATTLAPDTTPPVVFMTAPSTGSVVSSTVLLIATSSDNVGVASVSFKVDGTVVDADTTNPYTFSWDSTSVSNGSHTITATAVDTSGNQATSNSVAVTVSNPVNLNVAVDATSSATCTSGCSSLTFALTVSANATNRALAVFVNTSNNTGNTVKTVSSVTYNGVALIERIHATPSVARATDLWTLPDGTPPATGTHNVVVTLNGALAGSARAVAGAISLTGVNQASQLGATASNSGNGSSLTLTLGASGANDLVLVAACNGTSLSTTHANQTERYRGPTDSAAECNTSVGASAPGGTTNFSWTGGSDSWTYIGAVFKAGSSDATPPTTPTNLFVVSTATSTATISWTASTDPDDSSAALTYSVFRDGAKVGTTAAGMTTYTDTGLAPATTYSYAVSAQDPAGNTSAETLTVPATTQSLPAPVITSFTANPTSITAGQSSLLSWSALNATSLSIDQGIGSVLNETSTLVSPVSTIIYTLTASNSGGSVSSTASVAVSPDTAPPSVPTSLSANPVSTSVIDLTWTASTDNVSVAGYQVFRNGSQVATTTGASYMDAGLAENTSYTYTVDAFDPSGNISAPSSAASATTLSGPYQPVYPVKVSANGRYLVDQNNVPFMMVGDSPQSVIGDLSTSSAAAFFADRASHGFNTLWINLICDTYTFCNADGTTYDGVKPFTSGTSPSNYDLATPNETYFSRADAILTQAEQDNLMIILDPIETGGWLTTLENNGATKAYNYGVWVGNRYKNYHNILWMSGNDFTNWTNPTDDNLVRQVMAGIASVDPAPLQSIEIGLGDNYSNQDTSLAPYLTLDASYSYNETYDQVLQGYDSTPTMPDFMVEAHYEDENIDGTNGTPYTLREEEYWTMTSGATGQLYGSNFTDKIAMGWNYSDIDSKSVTQLGYMENFFSSYPWWNLVPDETHQVVTAGYGTYNANNYNLLTATYATTAWVPNGSLAITYTPRATTFTVNMAKMAGSVTAQWFDPSNATYHTISGSPFANTGTQQFATPGANSDGNNDWVLVLTAQDVTAPSVPTNLTATPVSSSQVNLSWTASTDNVGVAGYQVFRNGVEIATTTAASYADTGLAAQTNYSYAVTAFDAAGNISAASVPASATTSAIDTEAPTVPANLQASGVTTDAATISWNPSTDNVAVAGYNVFRNGTQIATASSTSYYDFGLAASTTYTYAVSAFDWSNNVSAQSTPLQVTTASVPPVPPSFVQLAEKDTSGSGSTASSNAFPLNVSSGDLIVVWTWYNSATQSITSMTDNKGNVYTRIVGPTTGTGVLANWREELWYAKNVTGGSGVTVTATFTGSFSGEKMLSAHEYTGLDQTSPLDAATAAAVTGVNLASPAATTVYPNELIFGAALFGSAGSAGPGFIQRSSIAANASEDKDVTSPGSYAATFTNGSDNAITEMATFKAAAQ